MKKQIHQFKYAVWALLSTVYKLQYHILFTIVFLGISIPLHAISEEYYIDEEDIIEESISPVPAKQKGQTAEQQPKVIIYNNHQLDQSSARPNMSTQPVVRVTGVPITKAPTAELRKSRQEAELLTEQKIVEKLESSRLRDEQERLKKLFPSSPNKTVVAESGSDLTVNAQVPNLLKEEADNNVFLGFHLGQSGNVLRQVDNLESYGSFGVSAGANSSSGLTVEGSLFFTPHAVSPEGFTAFRDQNLVYYYDEEYYTNISQWSGMLSVKYIPFSSLKLKPYIGIMAIYNIWQYTDYYGFEYNNCRFLNTPYCPDNGYKSHSVDAGLNLGLDVYLNKKLSIGAGLLINIYNIYHNNNTITPYSQYERAFFDRHNPYSSYNEYQPVKMEETNWIIASINAKLYF